MALFTSPKRHKRPAAELEWLATSKAETLPNGLKTYEWGDPKNPLVMLIHGWEGRGTQMAAFAQPLVDAGYHVIALDGPAHGDSPGKRLNAGIFSKSIKESAELIGKPVHGIIGHSFGAGCSVMAGSIGLEYKKLVHIAGPSDYMKVIRNFLNFVKLSSYSEKVFFKILMKESGLSLDNIHIGKRGVGLKADILIIHDKLDKEVPFSRSEELHALWPKAEVYATEGLGHRRILKDPAVIEKAIRFIQN